MRLRPAFALVTTAVLTLAGGGEAGALRTDTSKALVPLDDAEQGENSA